MSSEEIKKTGAGFVIYFNNINELIKDKPREILYLTLIDNNFKYDFPKGCIDPYEKPYSCAIRETLEETGLQIDKHYMGHPLKCDVFGNGLVMYLASYLLDIEDIYGTPNLRKYIKIPIVNEKSKIIEHKDYLWGTYDQIKDNFPEYLQDVLEWANNILTK